jgi:hypothetical protein
MRKKLTQERIAELDKFAVRKEYELFYWAMRAGIIPIDANFRVRRMVRIKKPELA